MNAENIKKVIKNIREMRGARLSPSQEAAIVNAVVLIKELCRDLKDALTDSAYVNDEANNSSGVKLCKEEIEELEEIEKF